MPTTVTFTTAGAISWDNTSLGATSIDLKIFGGGSGGGGGGPNFGFQAGGGGEEIEIAGLSVSAISYSGVIGDVAAGGVGGNGASGNNSTFTVGGTTYTAHGAVFATGGTGGNGTVNRNGGNGGSANFVTHGGGGGSSAGTSSAGVNGGTGGSGGAGGIAPTGGGDGGNGGADGVAGSPGVQPGGGGGGGGKNGNGGQGAAGKIILTYYAPPANTVAPAVTGTAQVGQTLTTTDGTWTGSPTFTYLWKHGDNSAAGGTATNNTYVPVVGDIGFGMKCVVTGTNSDGNAAATSNTTSNVLPAAPVADFTGTPLSGTAPLSVAFTDTSTNTPTSWLWEKNDGSGWVNFAGTPTVQNPTEVFATGTWSVRLTATNAGGSNTKTRTNYITATQPVPVNSVAPAVTPSSGLIGDTFTSTTGTWSNTPTGYSYQWKLDGVNVGTDANTYAPVAAGSLTCTVMASNSGGPGTPAVSNAVTVSAPAASGSTRIGLAIGLGL